MIPTSTAAGPPPRQWVLLICLFVLSLPAVTPRIYSSDEIQYFAYLRSLWFDRDLSFENEYRYFYDRGIAKSEGFRETFLERQTDTGRRLNFGTLGCAVLWSPFYLAGDLVARVTGAPRDGFSRPYVAAVAYGSALYGFLAVVLALRCAARLGLNGFGAALAVWLGTPLLFYMYVAPPFSHACSAFTVALFTFAWLRVRRAWRPAGLAALGAAGALMAMTREQDVFFIAAPALDLLLQMVRRPRVPLPWTGVTAAAAAFLAIYSPQLAAYRVVNGHFGPHASVANKMKWYAPHALQVLFSPEHGFFVWTPLAFLAVLGLTMVPRRADADPIAVAATGGRDALDGTVSNARVDDHAWICLLLMFVLQVYVSGSVDSWTVAGGFGQRRFVALTTLLVIGIAALTRPFLGRRLVVAAIALAVYWNLALTIEFATGLMDRQRLEPPRNAYAAFVTLPVQGPSIVYRYFADRSSFYKHAP